MTEEREQSKDVGARIPIVEERLQVGKEAVETGRVRVASRVIGEAVPVHETLESVRVRVEHVPVERLVDVAPPIRTQDGRTIISVTQEVLVKRVRVIEEIHLIEERSHATFDDEVTLRHTEVEITRS